MNSLEVNQFVRGFYAAKQGMPCEPGSPEWFVEGWMLWSQHNGTRQQHERGRADRVGVHALSRNCRGLGGRSLDCVELREGI